MSKHPIRLRGLLLALATASLAGACSSDVNPLREAYVQVGGGPKPVAAAPDFVANSRAKDSADFMAVGVSAPARPIRAKSSEGAKALEAELTGARSLNEAKGRAAESAGRATKPANVAQ